MMLGQVDFYRVYLRRIELGRPNQALQSFQAIKFSRQLYDGTGQFVPVV